MSFIHRTAGAYSASAYWGLQPASVRSANRRSGSGVRGLQFAPEPGQGGARWPRDRGCPRYTRAGHMTHLRRVTHPIVQEQCSLILPLVSEAWIRLPLASRFKKGNTNSLLAAREDDAWVLSSFFTGVARLSARITLLGSAFLPCTPPFSAIVKVIPRRHQSPARRQVAEVAQFSDHGAVQHQDARTRLGTCCSSRCAQAVGVERGRHARNLPCRCTPTDDPMLEMTTTDQRPTNPRVVGSCSRFKQLNDPRAAPALFHVQPEDAAPPPPLPNKVQTTLGVAIAIGAIAGAPRPLQIPVPLRASPSQGVLPRSSPG